MTETNATEKESSASIYHIDHDFEMVDGNPFAKGYMDIFYDTANDYWVPPISPAGLAQIADANPYHGSILIARANHITSRFVSGGNLRKQMFQRFARDYIQFGWGVFAKTRNHLGRVTGLVPLPSMYTRRRSDGDVWLTERDDAGMICGDINRKIYKKRDIIWISQYDPRQQIYSTPDYISGIQSTLLNKDSTLFRRRYYKNGAHLGYIFYSTDPRLKPEDEKLLKEKIASAKGIGNFKSMFINIPNGSEKGVQLIPVGNIATKDEFESIKSITAQDILVSHRYPPGLGGIIPTNSTGFGSIKDIKEAYLEMEVLPICEIIQDEVNNDPEIAASKSLQLLFNLNSDTASNSQNAQQTA